MVEELSNPNDTTPICCGQKVIKLTCNTTDGAKEKHVPQVSSFTSAKDGYKTGILVKVGSELHPMEKDHYIEWIEVIDGDRLMRTKLKVGDVPEVFFEVPYRSNLVVRAYCNKHGLWKNS
jgi:superoxide reductase